MKKAPIPHNEQERLEALGRYGILDTPSDAILDGIAQAAANLCEAPIALISLIDSDRQWFKSCVGVTVKETPRDISFCSHTILGPSQLMEVEDAKLDERFADNPSVTEGLKIRFYAGMPLVTKDNYALGSLCVIDYKPRRLTKAQKDGITQLAQVVVDLLDERQRSSIAEIDKVIDRASRHGVLITDATRPDNPITYANPAMETMTGYSSAELIGKNSRMLQGEDTDPKTVKTLRDAIAAEQSCTVIIKNYRKDGSIFWNELTVSPVKDSSGKTTNYVGVQHDVTYQQASMQQPVKLVDANADVHSVVATRNRLAQIIQESVNEIYVSHADTFKIIDANKASCHNLGYTIEESKELHPWDFVEGLRKENMHELVGPLLDGTLDAQSMETMHRRKDGTTYPVTAHIQYMGSQTPPVFTAIVQDITDRKQQEETISLRDNAIEALDVGLSITDASKSGYPLVYVNKALCDLTGYSAEELIGQSGSFVQGEEQQQTGHLKIKQAQAKGEPIQQLLKGTRKNGSQYMSELTLSPVHSPLGELTHYIGVTRDVTERLATEAQLRQAQKIDAIGQLSGGIAHDFNNLLSVISGNLEFLDLGITDDVQQECLDEAEKAAQMGARLTRRLLTFAKQGQLEPEVLNANKHVRNALELLSSTIGETITLTSNLSASLWHINADSSEIENTVVNLVINARDAMPNGGSIKVETANVVFKKEDIDKDLQIPTGDYIRLSVTDNGSGMTDEVQARIFEPFFTTKDQGKGTGLGLSSIHGFVTQSNGHVRVFSEVGHGTTIVLYLPRHHSLAEPEKTINTIQLEPTDTNARILIVEDNDMVRNMTVKRLRVLGYITEQACNGKEAVQYLENNSDVDLVFSDVVMGGGMSGYDLASYVQKNLPQCRVLLTSGYNDSRELDVQSAGLTVLAKPYSSNELQEAISAVMRASLA